ncbi:MAG: cytochrome P450, partial [Verrucomicrobia bacterium]|nr:cytochrome P450 [Verrucomicrobiota bacterium]
VAPLHLIDEEKNSIAISDALPDGITLTCVNAPKEHLVAPKGPKPLPFIGNMLDMKSKEGVVAARQKLVDTYGEMVALEFPGRRNFLCSDAEVLQDMLERPEDFQKVIPAAKLGLGNLRAHTTGDGLFTCSDSEEIWQIAHRILLPGFGVPAIRQYYDRMLVVADELIEHLGKQPEGQAVLITDWMTRMTFEAISYAGFSTRFHPMESQELPPFVEAMVTSLRDAMDASTRVFPESFYIAAKKKRQEADLCLQNTVDTIIHKRMEQMVRGEGSTNDLLHIMLTSVDRVTGKKLPEENIRNQLITFLIAGHETTSGLLSYAIYHLMSNPAIEKKLIEEVDQVLGRDFSYRPTYEDLEKLPLTLRVLRETLRLNPTAPGFSKSAMKDTVVAGKYALQKGDMISFVLPALHRDPRYWTGDPEHFDPDRFLPEEVKKRPESCYHPFGAGVRSCIGFQFALKEATMVLARLYQHFRFSLKDKNYVLEHVE